jgi:hypothetical protein
LLLPLAESPQGVTVESCPVIVCPRRRGGKEPSAVGSKQLVERLEAING